jgi:hypothetical protein
MINNTKAPKVEFELFADEYDHLLSLNFNNTLSCKELRPVFQGALTILFNYFYIRE